MKRLIVLFALTFGILFVKAVSVSYSSKGDNAPEHYIAYSAGIEAVYDEMKSGSWSYPVTKCTWVQPTTICTYDVIGGLKCGNTITDYSQKQISVVAPGGSYEQARGGAWDDFGIQICEYELPDDSKDERWWFSASLLKDCNRSDMILFFCYTDVDILNNTRI